MSGIRLDVRPELQAGIDRLGGEPGASGTTPAAEKADGTSFATVLEKTVDAANAQERDASAKADQLAAGRIDDLHGTMIAMKEADISLKLVGAVRNKLLDAFHELWRTSV